MKQSTLERYLCDTAKSARSSNEVLLPCEDGQSKEKSSTSSHLQEDTCTTSIKRSKFSDKRRKKRRRSSSISECPNLNKNKSCKDRSRTITQVYRQIDLERKLCKGGNSEKR